MDTIASWFSFITTPVSWVIVQFHTLYGWIFGPDTGWAWGLSIVSLVIIIRICLIPLFVKQIKATRAMQTLQPEMKRIQERYKSDKQRQSEEMMKLYKESGTNPLASCLPILVQSPFFFALYHVLDGIASNKKIGVINDKLLDSAQQAHIFGAPLAAKFTSGADSLGADLTTVRIVTACMIVMMSASQFFTQRQLMTKNVDTSVKTPFMQQQKMLMYVFPIMFAVFGINFPVGVLLYWLTTNVWTMGQQMYVIRQNPTPGSKAQAAYLERQLKHLTHAGKVRTKRDRTAIKAIVSKGRERNEAERKFINGLSKAGYAAQPDGNIAKGESSVATLEGGEETTGGAAQRRQQPKRQSKSQRQSGTTAAGEPGTSPSKQQGANQPAQKQKKSPGRSTGGGSNAAKPAGGGASGASGSGSKQGQRKGGPQRPKHPSSKK
ncbi:membrane protein insertase YidC [Streptomyces sp. SPB074]|uniref:membrane protein insertase YidC n=1 Tax=Streptomyces sp. (strain SPB074) TaxID=465543 RepID=UPI00017F19CE|nr:membrane protein insertase YidC [Streptomyces sp. SPB074]EDY45850.1 membrane protein OxaA [Streptomyces sp. SPB074]